MAVAARRSAGLLGLILALGVVLVPRLLRAEPGTEKEHQVKAAFVLNFAKFVEWPASRFPATNAPLVIGVLGHSPLSAALEEAVRGRLINGRPVLIQMIHGAAEARSVHLLVCAASDDSQLDRILPVHADGAVLTVGESEAFARRDGMISLMLENDKVRFDVNAAEAEKAGLKISAQLLKLAKTVRRKT